MLRNLPKSRYCGLTVILSNPSRFDKFNLLSANGGILFNDFLRPEFNQMMCDVRVMEDKSDFLEGTKAVLLLGEYAMLEWAEKEAKGYTLNELRGSVLTVRGLPAIASYYPQDAADPQDWESEYNEDSKNYNSDDEVSGDDEDEGDTKALSPTKRANYAFWLKRDIWKVKQLISQSGDSIYRKAINRQKPSYKIYPAADEVIQVLKETKNSFFYFDIETDYEEQNLLCFAFSFDSRTVYSVPILDNRYRPAYSAYHLIMRALAIAIRDNIVVAHNGASFDFFVLAFKYSIPVYKCYDTMLAMHRCFPSIEKSLGHCVSYWTWEKFHKDTDSKAYFTREDMMKKLAYCGKDVYTMALIHEAITSYAKTIPGLEVSIRCANDSIVPYLLMTLQGISYSQEALEEVTKENDKLMMQYVRMINLLIGEEGLAEIKTYLKGKTKLFPGSNKQCCAYFHDILGYPVLWRSPQTGLPSLGKKIMYRLAMKYPENAVIPLVLQYRKVAKETSALKFTPWRGDDGKVFTAPRQETLL